MVFDRLWSVHSDGQGGGPPRLERVKPAVPGASRGLAAPVVTASAALAAGLAYEGTLAEDSALRLCYLAAAAQAGGRLDLETERGRFRLHFKRGVIEFASSDAPEDDLGRFLIARGVVTSDAVADAERVRADLGGDLVAALASLGLMNPAESFRILQEHGALVVARALGAERGACRFDPTAPVPPSSFPIGSRWGVLCEATRKLDGLAIRQLLGERTQRSARRAGGRVDLSELKLTAHEARAVSLFDGRMTLAALAAARPAEAETILRVALLLGELELLAFGEPVSAPAVANSPAEEAATSAARTPPAAPVRAAPAPPPPPPAAAPMAARAPAASPPRPAPRPPPPAAPVKPAAEKKAAPPQDPAKLRAFHDRICAGDHFEALGVKRDATNAQIKAAYFQLAKTYHPDAGPLGEAPGDKKVRADIFARLGEAWGVLGEDAKRAEYLQELASGGKPDVDVAAIFRSEELFHKATALVRSRQYQPALATLGEAIKLNDEPEFSVWKAFIEFLVAPDQKRQFSASAAGVETALRKVPRCMSGYLFLGQMAKVVGQLDVAEKHLKRGLALEPEHVELVRELKYLKK
jgi:hypothetical protein